MFGGGERDFVIIGGFGDYRVRDDKFDTTIPYAKKCACNMHVTTNCMHVMVNMHVTLLLHEFTCMLYGCWKW